MSLIPKPSVTKNSIAKNQYFPKIRWQTPSIGAGWSKANSQWPLIRSFHFTAWQDSHEISSYRSVCEAVWWWMAQVRPVCQEIIAQQLLAMQRTYGEKNMWEQIHTQRRYPSLAPFNYWIFLFWIMFYIVTKRIDQSNIKAMSDKEFNSKKSIFPEMRWQTPSIDAV